MTDWQAMARLTYAPASGRTLAPALGHPHRRMCCAALFPTCGPCSARWSNKPLLLVRGEASDILLPDTVARMQALRPDMQVVALPGIGHAPTLGEPPVVAALRQFLARVG